jgi:uncharacterized protein (DUF1810 family)
MDSFSLQRFVDAQAPVWDDVRAELARARKRTHWMWFVFPQLAALGRSATARFYGISGADEAKAYLQHPLLGPRLLECCALLLKTTGVSASEVFGRVATGQQAMRPKGDCAMKAPADREGRKRLLLTAKDGSGSWRFAWPGTSGPRADLLRRARRVATFACASRLNLREVQGACGRSVRTAPPRTSTTRRQSIATC